MTDNTSSTTKTNSENILDISKQGLANGIHLVTINSNNHSSSINKRKLVLHFDNRNTLQVANSISATTIEQGVNNFLTGVLWGHEDESGVWKWVSTKPSLEKPNYDSDCITYFKYLEHQIVKKAIDRKDLRSKTGSFVQNEGKRFKPFYDELIEALRYYKFGSLERENEDLQLAHQHNEEVDSSKPVLQRRFSVTHLKEVPVNGFRSTDGTMYHYIFPAFFRLIQYLEDTKRDFVIYLRTMGGDSPNFLRTVKSVLTNQHPSFKFEKNVTIHSSPGMIKRSSGDKIVLHLKFDGDDDEEQIISDDISIHEKLVQGDGVHAIQDDFEAWCRTDFHYSTSKPVWFDPFDENPKCQHILFDDNFRVIDENDCIVDIRIMDTQKKRTVTCPFEFYPNLENIFAVQANLYSLLADEEYFVEQVRLCEENFDKLIQNSELIHSIQRKSFPDLFTKPS